MADPSERLCLACGEKFDVDDDFCPECGEKWVPAIPPGKKKCVKCSNIISLKARFCGKCGTSQLQQTRKRICCDEDIGSDDEFCCVCGKSWPKASDPAKKLKIDTPSETGAQVLPTVKVENNGTTSTRPEQKESSKKHAEIKTEEAPVAGSTTPPMNVQEQPPSKTEYPAQTSDSCKQQVVPVASATHAALVDAQSSHVVSHEFHEDGSHQSKGSPVPGRVGGGEHKQPKGDEKPEGNMHGQPSGQTMVTQTDHMHGHGSQPLGQYFGTQADSKDHTQGQLSYQRVVTEVDSKNCSHGQHSDQGMRTQTDSNDHVHGRTSEQQAIVARTDENSNSNWVAFIEDSEKLVPSTENIPINAEADPSHYERYINISPKRDAFIRDQLSPGQVPKELVEIQQSLLNIRIQTTEEQQKAMRDVEPPCSDQQSFPKGFESKLVDMATSAPGHIQEAANGRDPERIETGEAQRRRVSVGAEIVKTEASDADVTAKSEEEKATKELNGMKDAPDVESGGVEGGMGTMNEKIKNERLSREYESVPFKGELMDGGEEDANGGTSVLSQQPGESSPNTEFDSCHSTGTKRKKSESSASERQTDKIASNLRPETGKRKKSLSREPTQTPRAETDESSGGVPYNLRSSKNKSESASKNNKGGPSTNVQVQASQQSPKSNNHYESVTGAVEEHQEKSVEETEKMKKFKEGLPEGRYHQKKTGNDENPAKKRPAKSSDSRLAVDLVSVTFRVVVGPEFKYDPARHSVAIKFSAGQMGGGWNGPPKYYMHPERKLEDGYYLLLGTVPVGKHLLIAGGVEYKYVVCTKSSDEVEWEEILKDLGYQKSTGFVLNRQLSLKGNNEKDTLDVYDIIMFPRPKKFLPAAHNWGFKWGGYYHKASYLEIANARFIGSLAMLPEWPTYSENSIDGCKRLGSEFLPRVDSVLKNMQKLILDEYFKDTDQRLIQQIVGRFIETGVAVLSQIKPGPDLVASELRFFSAMATVHVLVNTRTAVSDNVLCLICDGLLLPIMQHGPDSATYENFITRHIEDCQKVFDFEIYMAKHGNGGNVMLTYGIHFNNVNLRKLLSDLIQFVRTVMSRRLYQWLYIMPLVHFLGDHCKPYEVKSFRQDHSDRYGSWWGIKEIQQDLDKFKDAVSHDIPLKPLMEKLQGCCQADYLLPRTILATLKQSELSHLVEFDTFDPEACLALVWYHFKTAYNREDSTLKSAILKVLEYIQCRLAEHKSMWTQASLNDKEVLLREVHLCTCICGDILDLTKPSVILGYGCKGLDYINAFALTSCNCIGLLWEFLNDHQAVYEMTNHGRNFEQDADNLQQKFINILFGWLEHSIPFSMLLGRELYDKKELKTWSCFLGIEWPNDQTRQNYHAEVRLRLEGRIAKLNSEDVIVLYSSEDYSKLHPVVEEVVSAAAFKAVERACASGSFWNNWRFDMSRVSHMLDKVFLNAYPEDSQDSQDAEVKLKHILQWPSMTNYIKFFYEKRDMLSKTCLKKMEDCINLLEDITGMVVGGSVLVDYLRRICENDKPFMDICELVISFKPTFGKLDTLKIQKRTTRDVLKKVLALRREELEEFSKVRTQVNVWLAMCKAIRPVDTDHLERKESVITNRLFLSQLCNPRIPGQSEKEPVKVIYFELPDAVYEILPHLQKYNELQLFGVVWKMAANQLRQGQKERVLTPEEVVKHVWHPSVSYCQRFCRTVQDGTIKLERVASLLKAMKNAQKLKEEVSAICTLNKIGGDLSWIDLRFKQFNQYEKMQHGKVAAETILQVCEEYELTGDFSYVHKLLESVKNPQLPLSSIEDNMVTAGQMLEKVGDSQLLCMRSFVKARDVVIWLRENLKGTREVKVLVDLAMIRAAGQGDVAVNRVSCLHLAVTGFAPLIYGLKESAGFENLMDCLEEVWHVLENDLSLPARLDEVSTHLQWLQEVHKAHGDVEMNALELAANINSKGVFQVQRLKAETDGILAVEDVVSLVLPMENERQVLGLKELHDLQSKLMLVAGKAEKGKDEVDRFSQVFDGIIKLASTYVKMCEAGNILFKDWKARFYCSSDSKSCVQMDFGLVNRKLIGRPTAGLDVVTHLDEICSFMENCLNGWLDYIQKQRNQYMELNYFTMSQLVKLRSKLAKLKEKEAVNPRIFHILHIVKENCTEKDLHLALDSAWKELQSKEKEMVLPTNDEEVTGTLSREAQFIQDLSDEGFPERVAAKALKRFGVDNFDEALIWCSEVRMGDEEEDDEEERAPIQSDKSWAWVQDNLLREAEENSDSPDNACSLKPLLETVWNKFLTSSTQSVSDYLSVEHLGLMLKHLRLLGKHDMNRTAPKHLVKGKPNLVVCPSRDIVNVALSIYNQDEGKPLPKRDEVLYCTENTTHEEVDLLWRRALSDKSGRIFCILFVEQLTYDVSEMAVRGLEKLMKDSNDYYLVIVCGSEGETKSQLVTAFENCRIGVPNFLPDQVNRYLKEKFKIAEDENPICLDSERSTVRLVTSDRPGMGKSLFVTRLAEKLPARKEPTLVTLPLHQRKIDVKKVLDMLLKHVTNPGRLEPRIYHFDIAYEVLEGVDYLLFNLLILGSVCDQDGNVWRRSPFDLYVVEALPRLTLNAQAENAMQLQHVVVGYLPSLMCRAPTESLDILKGGAANPDNLDRMMDEKTFISEPYQRVSQYLRRLNQGAPMNTVNPRQPEGTQEECLQTLLEHFGVKNPTWAELQHFVAFLDKQLRDFERSVFCSDVFAEDLPGFKAFVLRFMLQMSNDFATRSLVVSEETPGARAKKEAVDLDQYQLRRKWEESPHPFLFFNDDTMTMTFLGFNINRTNGNVNDPQTGQVIMERIMTAQLYDALLRNKVNLTEKFDDLSRDLKIEKLCKVIGVPDREVYDPDMTYQLTTDNVKKILAIQMRFRCNIPVVLMGETGCGKTRLIQFMCDLQVPPGSDIKNLIKVKTHGGTTEEDIRRKVVDACNIADFNTQMIRVIRGPDANIQTVLFFDEANTTEAIGLIKEIMVDKRMDGQSLNLNNGLKIVAACNPYRRHSPEMVKKLEQAGLGYYVKADETKEKLGEIPMRQLVYRVQALPQSLLPLVWDFGQLNTNTEKLYIEQIVIRFLREENFDQNEELCNVISSILAHSQEYIRENKDECIFVSLRDVERVTRVMMWFYSLRNLLFEKMDDLLRLQKDDDLTYTGENAAANNQEDDEEDSLADSQEDDDGIDPIVRSLILALGVCYVASLEKRKKYCKFIAKHFTGPCELEEGAETIQEQIECCQDVFVKEVQIEDDIARNLALKENLFMMVVCVELRIPLFLVGKPGSSKSLAKTIVDNALEGRAAKFELFRHFKQAHMISCQCSRLSTADVIVGTFQQCAKLQENKKDHLNEFVSVVILDEVGLAEDSPHMPLKTLHPLLEDGCIGDEVSEEFKKVAFIGISNWALDPAKTNRGILLQRGVPEKDELGNTARGICERSEKGKKVLARLIQPLTTAYWDVYITGLKHGSEFFGLRDFYSLIKMLLQLCDKSKYDSLSWTKLMHAIWRNFDGLENLGDKEQKNPIRIFEQRLEDHVDKNISHDDDPQSSSLVSDGLSSDGRYLLILTEKDTPLDVLHQQLPHAEKAIIIYGSSFPRDQEYTQVCRNINSIKMCMEAGRTVILHNLENLYESLYDALNQYYIMMGPNRFVDLGLGTQRVKCIVHKDFRLVVVAEKETVYKKFSIPLINRLEKHFMHVSSMLTRHQNEIVENLQRWAEDLKMTSQKSSAADVLVGYHVDAAATVVLQITRDLGSEVIKNITPDIRSQIEQESQEILLESADPEALIRLPADLPHFKGVVDAYFNKQSHESLAEYLCKRLVSDDPLESVFSQVTTYSKLLSGPEKDKIAEKLGWDSTAVYMKSLQAFNTEQQFSKLLRNLFLLKKPWDRVLILQCDSGNEHSQLLACARHYIINTYQQCQEELQENGDNQIGKTHVTLLIQLPRQKGGCFVSFQGGKWLSAHVDDLRPSPHPILVQQLKKRSVRELVENAVKQDPKCREYLTKMTGQRQLGRTVDDYDDMPPLEEPDDDVNVYRPEMDTDDPATVVEDGAGGDSHVATTGDGSDVPMEVEVEEDAAPMETDDVSDEHVVPEGGELCLRQLLFSCCCKAATMLRDINHQHTLERIHTIKEHFPEPEKVTEYSDFAAIIQMRLLALLNEKEGRAGSLDQARKWLNGALQSITEVGTFRRAWMSYIEKQVAPLLAGLLRYADTNNNMSILEKTPPGHWRHRLWLRMFSNPGATTLEYKDLLSVSSENLPEEFMVRMTGYGGIEMSDSLPFSWVIKDFLDNLLEQTKLMREGPESDLDDMFHQTEMGKCLKDTYDEVGLEKVVDLYMDDYVQMVYRVVTEDKEEEYLLVKNMIRTYCKNELKENKEEIEPFVMKLSDIHKTFAKIQKRVQNLSQLLSVFPEGINKVQDFLADPGNKDNALVSTTEMTQDLICVDMCIKHLKPDSKEVGEDPDMRQAWLLKVELLMPVLGRIIEQLQQSHEEFGPDCRNCHYALRCERDKVKAVYLFYKHVQAPQIKDDPMMKAKIPVWSLLRGECDFHKKDTMEKIRKIMKLCNDQASRVYLKIRETCGVCKDAMKEPVQLPCKDIFCKPCLDELSQFKDLGDCPDCKKKLPKDFQIIVMSEKKEAVEAHNRYKQRCNTFFIELIAQLVFVGNQQVEEAVVEMLLSCVTRESKLREAENKEGRLMPVRTKKLTVLDDCIDPTPVVRSLLLQLLLRARIDKVKDYMNRYFQQAKRFLEDNEQLLQLCLLFVHSFQDTFYHRVSQMVPGGVNEMEEVRNLLEETEDRLDEPALSMGSIEAIGKLRFCLDKLSGYICQAYILKKGLSKDRLDNLLATAENVLSGVNSGNVQWYLLRQLVRKSGLEYVLNMVQNNMKLVWILPPTISVKDFNQPHVLSIYGEPYEKLKVGIRQACQPKGNHTLVDAYKALPKKHRKTCLFVALYVDVTLSVADGTLDAQTIQNSALSKCLAKCEIDPNSTMVKGLLGNQVGQHGKQLTIQPNQSVTEQALAALITHFVFVLTNAPDNCLTKPFKDIIETPQAVQDDLLPTMPQDDLVEVYETMAKELKGSWDAHGNFGVYRCPNQHIFMVNNCGHLTDHKSSCPTCKAPIGGQSYNKPLPGVTRVRQDEIRDTTEKGHCLGPAELRTENAYPERKLNKLTMTVMRFLVHVALYAGANHAPQEVAALITPKLAGSVNSFLWDHLVFDLNLLTKCINGSLDDVFLLMHIFLKSITSTGARAQFSLKDKANRERWEEAFANTYLNPILNNYNAELQQATTILSGENKFLKKLYEQEEGDEDVDMGDEEVGTSSDEEDDELDFADVFRLDSLWRYKTRICLEDVVTKLDEYRNQRKDQKEQAKPKKNKKKGDAVPEKADPDDCDVLYKFLDKHEQLRAIRYLPSITRLVRGLVRENHRALYYNEANKLTLDRFLKNVSDRSQMYNSFIDDFAAAWDIVRPFLPSYVFGGLSVPKEYTCEPIRKDKTVIATLLPATEGRGLCAVGLIHFLAGLQNEFLQTMPGVNLEDGVVCMEEVFPSNLIYFHPNKDLLPMFLAHCDYSLEVGKTLQITYNFPALQRHLEERLLRGIPLIEIKVEHILYREDLTNATKLANLNDIIPQEYLSGSVVRQIQGGLRHLSDITECLLMLDIALGFLMSFRNQSPHKLLTQFLSETLGLNTSFFPPKAHQACELRHVKALWLLLSHESAKNLSKTAQDPFERVRNVYTKELTDNDKADIDRLLPHLNTDLFLAELHECILMQITRPVEMTADEQVANWKHSLVAVLYEYMNSKDEPPEIPVIQQLRLPDTILASKCVSVWKYIFQRSIQL